MRGPVVPPTWRYHFLNDTTRADAFLILRMYCVVMFFGEDCTTYKNHDDSGPPDASSAPNYERQEGQDGHPQSDCVWPRTTSNLCWWCSHSFDCVPCYAPCFRYSKSNTVVLYGTFCSWNCTRSWVMVQRPHAHKPTVAEVGLFAYLTVHRPRFCPIDSTKRHPSSCFCLDQPFSVRPAPPKECLDAFGGSTSITEYRKDFMTIRSYSHVSKFAVKNTNMRSDWNGLMRDRKTRSFVFEFEEVKAKPAVTQPPPPQVRIGHTLLRRMNTIN